jgi:hypothetical protein
MARLALGIAQRGGTFGQTATGHGFLRYVTMNPGGQPAAPKRSS